MILKIKDIVLTENNNENSIDASTFNKYYKNKYVYCVSVYETNAFVEYAIPFDDAVDSQGIVKGLTEEQYIELQFLSETPYPSLPANVVKISYEDISIYVDIVSTDIANSVIRLKGLNSFSPDEDITVEELKKFRKWLADAFLGIYEGQLDDKTQSMLEYYSNNMEDDATELIKRFNDTIMTISSDESYIGCGCSKTSLTIGTVAGCDIIASYRKNIHDFMAATFSNVEFWNNANDYGEKTFAGDVIKYLKGIINGNFPLEANDYAYGYGDCTCLSSNSTAQQAAMQKLKDLKKVMEYVQEGTTSYHKNFVYNTLSSWSNSLYEYMYWA